MADFDFVAFWKLLSTMLTGGFGVMALLTKYKDADTGRITRWGAISLAGIVFSTVMGLAAQVVEMSHAQVARESSAKQTLKIVEQTQRSVVDIERLIQEIDAPEIDVSFLVPCKKATPFCSAVKADNTDLIANNFDAVWSQWPKSAGLGSDQARLRVNIQINLGVLRQPSDWTLEYLVKPLAKKPSESIISIMEPPPDSMLVMRRVDGDLTVAAVSRVPVKNANVGNVRSFLDLQGASIEVYAEPEGSGVAGERRYLEPLTVTLRFSRGRVIHLLGDDFHEIPSHGYLAGLRLPKRRD